MLELVLPKQSSGAAAPWPGRSAPVLSLPPFSHVSGPLHPFTLLLHPALHMKQIRSAPLSPFFPLFLGLENPSILQWSYYTLETQASSQPYTLQGTLGNALISHFLSKARALSSPSPQSPDATHRLPDCFWPPHLLLTRVNGAMV